VPIHLERDMHVGAAGGEKGGETTDTEEVVNTHGFGKDLAGGGREDREEGNAGFSPLTYLIAEGWGGTTWEGAAKTREGLATYTRG
jgi:hypothetical protein